MSGSILLIFSKGDVDKLRSHSGANRLAGAMGGGGGASGSGSSSAFTGNGELFSSFSRLTSMV